jgi:hypothetical protein
VPVKPERAVTRADWKTLDLPEAVSRFDLDLVLDSDELGRVSMGHLPEDMDDKWFIYREGGRLLFHRSWTGSCVYSAAIEESSSGGRIGEVLVNRDPEQYRETDDRYDARLLRFLIERILLNRNAPFPSRPDATASAPPGLYQHAVAGTGAPDVVERADPPKGEGGGKWRSS